MHKPRISVCGAYEVTKNFMIFQLTDQRHCLPIYSFQTAGPAEITWWATYSIHPDNKTRSQA